MRDYWPEKQLASKTIAILDDFIMDIFLRIAREASDLANLSKRKTLMVRDIEAAVRLVLVGGLTVHALAAIKYVYVFMPLWIWKTLVILGSFIGTIVFLKNPQYRHENDSYIQFKSMLISLSLHLILLMFEFLLCDRLSNNGKQNLWILVFIPLIVSSIISVFFCIWAIKQQNDRSFELELFLFCKLSNSY
jgi:uncharacterized membrane protein YhaH (DUF805 family)